MSHNAAKLKDQLIQISEAVAPVYWKSIEEFQDGPRASGEFPGGLPNPSSYGSNAENTRRDFLARMGFTALTASLAACRAPVQNAIPLMVGSDQLIPGVSSWYATTCGACPSACSLLVKQRDGRPIKIEGNDQSKLFGGGTCATGQAAVLSLYDGERLRGPFWQGKPIQWPEVDARVSESLRAARESGGRIVLLSGTITSPSTLEIINEWRRQYANFRHVVYDAISLSAMRAANAESFGRAVIPHYAFDKARMIVGLEADFLGTWLSPVEFAHQYASFRRSEDRSALHVQIESGLSLTGSNADVRIAIAPSEMGIVVATLLHRITQRAGIPIDIEPPQLPFDSRKLDAVIDELWRHRGESLVVSGIQDKPLQIAVNAINAFLGNVGKTVDLARPSQQRGGDDAAVAELIDEMDRGSIHMLMLYGVNPGYDYPEAKKFVKALSKVKLAVSFSDRMDETSPHVHAVCPDHHFLESWGDAEPVQSYFSLAQPTIAPLFDTRAAQQSLRKWLGNDSNHYTYLRAFWQKNIFPRQKEFQDFSTFWDHSLQSGVLTLSSGSATSVSSFHGDWKTALQTIAAESHQENAHDDRYELHFYESVALRDGRHANNPWLQELPDPITKVTWGNYAAIAPKTARKFGLTEGDVISLKTDKAQLALPIFIQPGQHERTVSVALGYGRRQVGKAGKNVGADAFPLTSIREGSRLLSARNATLEKTGRREELASTQNHFSMEGRPIVLETTAEELHKEEAAREKEMPTLWPERLQGEHSWGMAIDINACTGCSACVIACQAENNVPVVGKDQVRRTRIMHWIRIDHYYSGSEEDPASRYQPMMCQHCGHAPCETVCPVLATTTSSEGINQQVYNRCIGTRYCLNNCPYKVRRFNWYNYTDNPSFDYAMANPVGRMVLNPDVVVRSRGVMEKCSLCVQRIQLAKNIALQEKREIVDGDIKTACQQACPTQAIVFGDLKDPNSRVSQLHHHPRYYQVLEDLGTRPNVGYLKKIRTMNKV